jgi:hypothetical protein
MSLRSGSGVLAMMFFRSGFARHGPISKDDVTVECVERPDGTLEAKISDSIGNLVMLHGQMPEQESMPIQIKWDNGTVSLEIDGSVADSQTYH